MEASSKSQVLGGQDLFIVYSPDDTMCGPCANINALCQQLHCIRLSVYQSKEHSRLTQMQRGGKTTVPNYHIHLLQHKNGFILVQLIPSPSNPWLQVHEKLPIMSTQVAFIWQLSLSWSHSSMSVNRIIQL